MTGGYEFNEVFFDDARIPAGEHRRPARRGLAGLARDARARAQPDRQPALSCAKRSRTLVELARARASATDARRSRTRACASGSPRSRATCRASETSNLRQLQRGAARRDAEGHAADDDEQALLDRHDAEDRALRLRPDRRRRLSSPPAKRSCMSGAGARRRPAGCSSTCSRSGRDRGRRPTSSATSSASAARAAPGPAPGEVGRGHGRVGRRDRATESSRRTARGSRPPACPPIGSPCKPTCRRPSGAPEPSSRWAWRSSLPSSASGS